MTDTQNEKSINNSLSGIQIGCKDTTFFQTDKIFLLFSIKNQSNIKSHRQPKPANLTSLISLLLLLPFYSSFTQILLIFCMIIQ